MGRGLPVVSGPYRLALSEPQQRLWICAQIGGPPKSAFSAYPGVERIIYLPQGDENKWIQLILANQMDQCIDLRPSNIKTLLDQNPNVTTWSGRQLPYGYRDWWPPVLGFNNLEPPFDDPDIRWAVNYAIDREQLVAIGWQGGWRVHPFAVPPLPTADALYQPSSGLARKVSRGETRPSSDRSHHGAQGLEQRCGRYVAAGRRAPENPRRRLSLSLPRLHARTGRATAPRGFRLLLPHVFRRLYPHDSGHGPRLYHGQRRLSARSRTSPSGSTTAATSSLPGTAAQYFWRWRNADFDRLVDQMGQTAPDDPALVPLFRQALDIWLAELPAIPLLQWFHRIPHNQTYWKNWPSAENPYMNSAYWVRSFLIVLLGLEPTQP